MLRFSRAVLLLLAFAGALVIAACGSSSSSSSSSASTSSSGAAATTSSSSAAASSGSCGTVPQQAPSDPDGVLAKFPQAVQAAYDLFPGTVNASAWSSWKPTHKPPYTIYFSPGNTSTPFIQEMMATLNQLKAKSGGEISKVIVQDSNNSLQTQIQQIQQAIQQKVDIMIVLPLSPAGDAGVEASAGKAGIPVLAPLNPAANKYVVGVQGNITLEGAKVAQTLASILGDKGNILDVHGIPGVPADSLIYQGADLVFKNCPNMKTAGSIVGQFTPSVAKTQTLEFLSSHPAAVDAAIQTGGMATGIMQAFIQTGRHVPTVADVGATPGALGYWDAHKTTYKGVAAAIPPIQLTEATWNLALGLLASRGIKIDNIMQAPIIVTDQNLSQWVQPGWNLNTPIAYAPGPPNALLPATYLNQFFTKSASK